MRIEKIINVEPVGKLPDIDNYAFEVYNGY